MGKSSAGMGMGRGRGKSSAGMADIIATLFLLYYEDSMKLPNMSFRSAWQYAAVSVLRPFGKSQSTELWILLIFSHVEGVCSQYDENLLADQHRARAMGMGGQLWL